MKFSTCLIKEEKTKDARNVGSKLLRCNKNKESLRWLPLSFSVRARPSLSSGKMSSQKTLLNSILVYGHYNREDECKGNLGKSRKERNSQR